MLTADVISELSFLLGNLTKNKGYNTPGKIVLDGHWAKYFLFSLKGLVFNPAGYLDTILTTKKTSMGVSV